MATNNRKAAVLQENLAPTKLRLPAEASMPSRKPTAARGVAGGWLGLAGFALAPLAVVGVWLLVRYARDRRAKAKGGHVLPRSVSMATLHGGKKVIHRMIDAHDVELNKAGAAMEEMRDLLKKSRINFVELDRAASKLEMSGQEEEAAKVLEDALKKAKNDGQSHEAHELQMLLIEMLIYKGEYKQVFDKFVFDKDPTDARVPLFKAIVYSMLGRKKEAYDFYEQFQEIRNNYYTQDTVENSNFYRIVKDFSEFENLVGGLKEKVDKVRTRKGSKSGSKVAEEMTRFGKKTN